MDNSNKLIFNHFYKLRHDSKRSHIFGSETLNSKLNVQAGFISKIHPIYAMVLSFFSTPITLIDAIKQISNFLESTEEETQKLISPFIKNDLFFLEYQGFKNIFPPNIVIDAENAFTKPVQYIPSQFVYDELDLKQERFFVAPKGIVFMINNICATNCVYCYADKFTKTKTMPLTRIREIIQNAFELGVTDFTIIGGEFFLYREWENLLNDLIQYNYKPSLISTKVPVTEDDIDRIKKYDIPIQVSLDSVNPKELMKILDVKENYAEKIKTTITLLDQKNIRFQISTVLTKYNESTQTLQEIHDFLQPLKNLVRWEIRVAFKSLYSRGNFSEIKSGKEKIFHIDDWVQKLKKYSKVHILWSPNGIRNYFQDEGGSRNFTGSRCSANYSHIVVLPDGKVTICEQLYWNPRFLIGNLSTQSIEEVWNSSQALKLAFPQKESFREKSACKKCSLLDECIAFPNKCYADILKGYGDKNWDYPDPRCAKAPKFIYELTYD